MVVDYILIGVGLEARAGLHCMQWQCPYGNGSRPRLAVYTVASSRKDLGLGGQCMLTHCSIGDFHFTKLHAQELTTLCRTSHAGRS